LSNFANKASTAVLGVGVALGAYAVDQAFKFQEGMDTLANQTNLTKSQLDRLGTSIQNISDVTGVSNADLQTSALTIYQAGYKGAQATKLLTDAAKASVITNASVTDTTQALVAAQSLQIAKGMDVTKLTGILVKGSKEFVGGLSAEEQMLSGRVGVALANYGLNLKTIIPIGAQFAKDGLPTRSISSFANALGNIEKPMTDSKGKLTTYASGLEKVGLSQATLSEDLRKGNIVGILTQIKDVAASSGKPLSEIANAVFGTTGGAAASALVRNLSDLASAQQNLTGAGAGSLQSGFKTAVEQLGPQLKVLKANFDNLMVNAGKLLLPALSDVTKWANDFFKALKDNPILRDVLGAGLATVFALALAVKIKSLFSSIAGLFGKGSQAVQLDANTTALQENTDALLGKSGGGLGGAGEATSAEEAGGAAVAGGAVAAAAVVLAPFAALAAWAALNPETNAQIRKAEKIASGQTTGRFGLVGQVGAGQGSSALDQSALAAGLAIERGRNSGTTNVTVHVHAR
jgi:TP901 family phage tail tape measure protein